MGEETPQARLSAQSVDIPRLSGEAFQFCLHQRIGEKRECLRMLRAVARQARAEEQQARADVLALEGTLAILERTVDKTIEPKP